MDKIVSLPRDKGAMAALDQDKRQLSEVGHYFDQVHFDLHYQRLARRAEAAEMARELEAWGVSIDPITGAVFIEGKKASGQ